MIWIAIWFTAVVVNATDVVLNQVQENQGWMPLYDLALLIGSTWFLVDAIKKEFLDS